METFVNKEVQKMMEKFDFEQLLLIGEETGEKEEDETDEDAIAVQSDDDGNAEGNETVATDLHGSFLFKKDETLDVEVRKDIHYQFFPALPVA